MTELGLLLPTQVLLLSSVFSASIAVHIYYNNDLSLCYLPSVPSNALSSMWQLTYRTKTQQINGRKLHQAWFSRCYTVDAEDILMTNECRRKPDTNKKNAHRVGWSTYHKIFQYISKSFQLWIDCNRQICGKFVKKQYWIFVATFWKLVTFLKSWKIYMHYCLIHISININLKTRTHWKCPKPVFEISLENFREMSCQPSNWNMSLMLEKLSAQAIFIGSGLVVQHYFKNCQQFHVISSNVAHPHTNSVSLLFKQKTDNLANTTYMLTGVIDPVQEYTNNTIPPFIEFNLIESWN